MTEPPKQAVAPNTGDAPAVDTGWFHHFWHEVVEVLTTPGALGAIAVIVAALLGLAGVIIKKRSHKAPLVLAAVVACVAGCSYTQIEIPLPDGSRAFYRSTRDSDITGLHVEITPEGHVTIDLEGASGQASLVVQAYGQVMAAGLRALAEGTVPGP